MKQIRMSWLILLLLTGTASPAFAHPGHSVSGNGLVAGLLHPLLGWDHLLAMLTVGLLSAQLGGRALWAVPGTFVGSMIVGGIVGMLGWEMPALQSGIAASVLVMGVAVALDRRFTLAVPLSLAGLFGFVHGQAHGVEMPLIDNPALYAVGFVLATACLHAAGVHLGHTAQRSAQGTRGLRLSGGAIALAGCWLMLAL